MNEYLAINRVAFTIFNFDVYWYGLIMCLAIIISLLISVYFCNNVGYSTELPINIAIVMLPCGILSARLFAVLFDDSLKLREFFNFRTGGMSIIGAVIGGALGLIFYAKLKKERHILRWFDVIAPVLILAQALGRWGNYFNSEVYGIVVSENFPLKFFPFVVEISNGWGTTTLHYALFFYESVLDLIGFVILARVFHKSKVEGQTTALYLIYYGVIRTVLEHFREDAFILRFLGLPISQICSGLMIVIGIVLFVVVQIRQHKKVKQNEGI